MRDIVRSGDRTLTMPGHCAEVRKRPPTPTRYTGLQFIAHLGGVSQWARSGAHNRQTAQRQSRGFEMLRLQRPVRRCGGVRQGSAQTLRGVG